MGANPETMPLRSREDLFGLIDGERPALNEDINELGQP